MREGFILSSAPGSHALDGVSLPPGVPVSINTLEDVVFMGTNKSAPVRGVNE